MKCDGPAPIPCLLRRETRIIKPASVEDFGGAVGERAPRQCGDSVESKSKPVFRLLDFSKGLLQGISSLMLLSNIHCRSNALKIARFISHRMSDNMDMFDGTIRHQQSIFKFNLILPPLRHTLDYLFYKGDVFRMNPLENEIHGRFPRPVVLEHSKTFL